MGKSILVTGGAGYIGSHACKALAKAGYEPVAYDNLVYGHKEAVRWGPFVEGDIGDRAKVAETIRRHNIGAVMHFAAFAYVGELVEQPEKYFQNNVVNTLSMLEAMRATEVKQIVFSSTCATYGLPEQMPIREDTPQRPVNPYGETKLMIERALYWYGVAHGLRSVALRYFNAAGADPDGEIGEDHNPETHLIPLILDAADGTPPAYRRLRHRLPDAGWQRGPRLYPCAGSGRRACPRAALSRRRRREPRLQSRHRSTAIRCARRSRPRAVSPAGRSRARTARAAPAIRRCWSPMPASRKRSSAGCRRSARSSTSSARPGPGIKNASPRHPAHNQREPPTDGA